MRLGQPYGVKLSGQCTFPKKGNGSREVERKLQASMRLEARLDGMVNESELLINVVTVEEPKMLIGSPKRDMVGFFC